MKKAQKPFFSVLTPAWNRADFLEILIDSLQGQTFQNFEWVIGNDGSTDGSHELLMKRFADLKIPITITLTIPPNKIGVKIFPIMRTVFLLSDKK